MTVSILTKKRVLKYISLLIVLIMIQYVWHRIYTYYPPIPPEIWPPPTDKYLIKYENNYWKPEKVKKILVWTGFFDVWDWAENGKQSLKSCSNMSGRCEVTGSRSELWSSNALLFHAADYWKLPSSQLPQYRHPSQVWAMFSQEATPSMWGSFPPHVFNWTVNYRRDSTIGAEYGRYIRKTVAEIHKDRDTEQVIDYFSNKTKMAVIQVSNCRDNARRYRIIHELSKHIEVDQYGYCPGNVICGKGVSFQECVKLLKPYKFYLAFENCYCRDYITEKYWQSQMDRLQIPVVAASRATLELLPPHSYLNVFDFPTLKDLANKMLEIGNNATLYNSYFEWKKYYKPGGINIFCVMCELLHKNMAAQSYDLEAWIKYDSCSKPTVANEISRYLDRTLFDLGF